MKTITPEDIKRMTPEQLKQLAASMYNPVKICNAYLPSKVHNDIIRQANPTWSDEKLPYLMDESEYSNAVELEEQCKYDIETQTEGRGRLQFVRRYKAKCVSGLNEEDLRFAAGVGPTENKALKDAKEKAVFFLERKLLENKR